MKRIPQPERIAANPLAQQYEDRHSVMLDEVHRLISLIADAKGCVTMPHGLHDLGDKFRRSTDRECAYGEIFLSVDLSFNVEGETVADTAAEALEVFAARLNRTAQAIRENGAVMEAKRPDLKVRRA